MNDIGLMVNVSWDDQSPGEMLCQIAEVLETAGLYDHAISYYRHALVLQPEDSLAAYRLGKLLLRLGDNLGAMEALLVASTHLPEHPDTLYSLGKAYFNVQEYALALNMAERVLTLQPHHSGAFLQRLRCLVSLGDWEQVRTACQHVPDSLAGSGEVVLFNYLAAINLQDDGLASELYSHLPRKFKTRLKAHLDIDIHSI